MTWPDHCSLEGAGLDPEALERYLEEQIYSLPGADAYRESFTILLTGSRAMGRCVDNSDVDLEVVCPAEVRRRVQRECLAAGVIQNEGTSFFRRPVEDWGRYFGEERGRPHFAITPLETVQRHFREFDDIWLWIWTNARIIVDPGNQFTRVRDSWHGYPRDVLVRKLKHRWLTAWYWVIDVYPHHHAGNRDMLAAAQALLNGIAELLKFFFLADGRPFPYHEKLLHVAEETTLGRRYANVLLEQVELVVGCREPDLPAWQRLEKVAGFLLDDEAHPLYDVIIGLDADCCQAMREAGVERDWVDDWYPNIGQLLNGELGPPP